MKKRKILISLLCAAALLGASTTTLTSCGDKDKKQETPVVEYWKVTIDLDNGTTPFTKDVVKGEKLTDVATPTKEGYTFDGWKANGTSWSMDTAITADITIVAQWKEKQPVTPVKEYWTVTIDLDNGTTPTTKKVEKGQKLTGVADPTKDGYTFKGWKANGEPWTMETAITADITIVAQWKENEAPVAKFTVSFDSKGGSDVAALTDVADGSKITSPADPTKEGYRFAGWYTDEECKDAWDFDADTVTSSMTLYAKWNSLVKISQAAVESLQTAICIDGSYVYTSQNYGEEAAGITTIFEPTSVKVLEYDLDTNAELYLMEIVEYNGNCAYVEHTIQNVVRFQDLNVPFDEYDNPFKDLTIDDFAHVGDNVFQVIDDGAGNLKAIASCITGWTENIKSILVTVEDDKIVHVVIETNVMTKTTTVGEEEVTDSYSVVYTFNVKDHGTAKTGILVGPYERVPEHDLLEAALNNMNHNHTIHCLDVALGYDDVTYEILVNENVVWDTYDNDGTTYGYAEIDGSVYEFRYTDGVVTVGDPLNVPSLSVISSCFTTFAPEVMKYVGNNTFISYNTDLAQEILSYIGPDYDRQRLGSYSSFVEIEIKDGYVYRVTFDYSVYGIAGTITMIYDAFDETTIDIDFSDIEHTSVLDPYMGTWTTSEAGGHTIVVNDLGVFVDDAEYVITDYDAEYGFTGTVDGDTYYLTLWTEREILFYNETQTVFWFFQKEGALPELVTIPDGLKGVWITSDESMTVTIQTHAVFVNGISIDLVYYSESDEILTVSYNGGSYYIFTSVDEETGDTYLYFARNDLSEFYQLSLTAQSIGFEIPTSYVGIWENEDDDIRIVIRYSGITINGEKYVITSYDKNDGFVGTLGNITGYMIAPYFTDDKLQVGTMSNNSIVTKISDNPKDEDTKIYEIHYGYYEGTSDDETKYAVLINANGIFINDVKYTITLSSDVSYDGIWQGEVWYLIYDYVDTMALMNSDGTVYIACVLTDNPNPDVEIVSAHYGTYISSNEAYTVVVSSDGITINGEAFVLTEYDELDGYIGTWNGETYYLSYIDYTDPIAMALSKEDYSLYVLCPLTTNTPEPTTPEVQPEHVGTYVGTSGEVTYTIIVTEDEITINGDTYQVTAYDEYEGYTGTWNGEVWYLVYYEPNMRLMSSDFTTNVLCNLNTTPVLPAEVQPEHVGTYVGTADDVTYTIVVSEDGITINDTEVELKSYVEDDYNSCYTVTWNEADWTLSYLGAWGSYPAQFILSDGNDTEITCDIQNSTPDTPVEVQPEHVGTYVGTADDVTYTIVVTEEGITINDTEVELKSYVEDDYNSSYTVTWNEADWTLSYLGPWGSYPAQFILSDGNDTEIICDIEAGELEVQPEHVGTYVGTAGEVTYTVVVKADGITINGDAYTLIAYSDYEGYTGTWNDAEWYLMYFEPNMRLISSDYATNVVCNFSTTPDTSIEVQPEHVGTYEGTAGEDTYTIVVSEDGITINGGAYTITEYDEYYGYTGTWNGEVWYLSYVSYSDPVMMTLMDESTSIMVNCSLSA